EVLINDSIWVVDEGSLVEQTQVSSTRRGDFNADGVIDHAENWEHAVDLRWGQSVGVGEPTLVFWDLVDRERESLELLESVDVDGDGRDEVIGLQKVGSEYSLLVGGTHVDCYDLR
ncbi:MAG: hypothetical protein KDK70_15550, partial [Myxococcales bacterium]|nr:hypothetical protein [Myxococcales bacterium]